MEHVSWSEPACLVRAVPGAESLGRQIVIEGSFAEIVLAFRRFRVEDWPQLTISFTERRRPPYRLEHGDFTKHVLSRLFAVPTHQMTGVEQAQVQNATRV